MSPPSLEVCKERLDEHLLEMLREEPWTTRSLKQVQDPETRSFNERLGEDEMMASLGWGGDESDAYNCN